MFIRFSTQSLRVENPLFRGSVPVLGTNCVEGQGQGLSVARWDGRTLKGHRFEDGGHSTSRRRLCALHFSLASKQVALPSEGPMVPGGLDLSAV